MDELRRKIEITWLYKMLDVLSKMECEEAREVRQKLLDVLCEEALKKRR